MPCIPEDKWVPISALNHFVFCPRRCYYIHVEQMFIDNVHTLQGERNHQHVHRDAEEHRDGCDIQYQMTLFSRSLGLYGQGDKVEFHNQTILPIEYKKGRRKRWRNDAIQLCAQALCLEEMVDRSISIGYIYYEGSKRRQEVQFNTTLRKQTYETIEAVRELMQHKLRPHNPFHKRCNGCSFEAMCMPSEMERLRTTRPTQQ